MSDGGRLVTPEQAAAAERRRREQAEADRKAAAKAEREALESGMKRRFISAGGTEAEWALSGPKMVAAAISAKAEAENERARKAFAEMTRRDF